MAMARARRVTWCLCGEARVKRLMAVRRKSGRKRA
jgi:hypothetical protein